MESCSSCSSAGSIPPHAPPRSHDPQQAKRSLRTKFQHRRRGSLLKNAVEFPVADEEEAGCDSHSDPEGADDTLGELRVPVHGVRHRVRP